MYGIGSAKRKKTMNPFETFAYTFHISYGLFIHIRIFKTIAWNSMYEKFHSGSAMSLKESRKKIYIIITCYEIKRTSQIVDDERRKRE